MKKKIIGITPRLIYEDGVEKQFVNTRYISFLERLGFNYLMINLDNPSLDDILSLCDGFLITGGDDIDPKFYSEENTASVNVSSRMDETDLRVIDFAVKNKRILLGICRGFQVINVYFGGSLYQDIQNHQKSKHIIQIVNNTYTNLKEFETNSYHHQAINRLGDDLILFAKTNDGIIEGFYHKTLPILAVEWHPEIDKGDCEIALFKNFVASL